MSFSGEGHRLHSASSSVSAASSAEDAAELRARTRDEIVDRWLPVVVDEALDDQEIAAGIAQAGLDRETLRQQVLDARGEVLAPAATQLDRAVDVTVNPPSEHRERHWTHSAQKVGGNVLLVLAVLAIIGLVSAFSWSGLFGTLLFAATGAWLSWAGSRGDSPSLVAVSPATAVAAWRQVCRDEGVLPYLRRVVNENLAPIARFQLGVTTADAPGLLGTGESSFVVRTASVERFLTAAERLPSGAIGLAGPRGVGKTSLIEYFAGQVPGSHLRPLQVTVTAPVQYEPRDFVLHLFASVCEAVIRARPFSRLALWPFVRPLRYGVFVVAVLVAAVLVLGTDVFTDPGRVFGDLEVWDGVLIGGAGLGAVLLAEVLVRLADAMWWRRRAAESIAGLARRHLQNIRYQQTHTTGWSGKLTLPLNTEAGVSRQVQRERRPQTYPELVAALREFLETIAAREPRSPAVVIAVDELDKIESAHDAQRFLNEIKGIFGAPGTQFLVSVSEDALASFERRGLPVRDAFDSTFHEIVRVDYLTLADTAELLSSRVLRLPEPFKWLVHCLSGGLPRDVVRTARAMVALAGEPPPSLDDVCAALVAEDLARKSHAFQLACRGIGDSPDVTEFIRSLRKLRADGRFLLALLPDLRGKGALADLGRQAATYVYYLATVLEVFRRDKVDSGDENTFDLLARARQSLAVHPRLAWLQVDEFREAWELPTVPVD